MGFKPGPRWMVTPVPREKEAAPTCGPIAVVAAAAQKGTRTGNAGIGSVTVAIGVPTQCNTVCQSTHAGRRSALHLSIFDFCNKPPTLAGVGIG